MPLALEVIKFIENNDNNIGLVNYIAPFDLVATPGVFEHFNNQCTQRTRNNKA
jgi:hypothetical protein